MFTLDNVNASYKSEQVLKGISLNIQHGQKVALIGSSGSGKSTLLNLLYKQHPKIISLIPQHHGLVSSLSVFHNVYMGQLGRQPLWYNLINLIKPLQKPINEVSKILDSVNLHDKLMQSVGELSGGQQQRTSIARALMHDSDTLLADEPISSLDEQQSKDIMQLLMERFNTVVLAMHDIDLAMAYCDRIIGLKQGVITLDKSTNELNRQELLLQYGE